MTATRPQAHPARQPGDGHPDDEPIGAIFGEVRDDFSRLVQEQLALAKLELKQEAGRAGAGAGLLGGALFAVYMVLMFGSVAAVYGLGHLIGNGWAALIVAGAWALAGLLMGLGGKRALGGLSGPRQTIETLKENVAWLRSLRK